MLTGSEYPPDRQRAYELGANSFMVKPGGLDEFFAMIDAVMGEAWISRQGLTGISHEIERAGQTFVRL